jgi:hypothetical protein
MALHVRLHVAHLDRAGVRAEHHRIAVLRGRRCRASNAQVIFRRVQCSEIVKVGLDFGAVGHIETNAAEQLLDTFQGAHHRMQPAYCPDHDRAG